MNQVLVSKMSILTKEEIVKMKMVEALILCQDYFTMLGGQNHYASRSAREKTKSILSEIGINSIEEMENFLNQL